MRVVQLISEKLAAARQRIIAAQAEIEVLESLHAELSNDPAPQAAVIERPVATEGTAESRPVADDAEPGPRAAARLQRTIKLAKLLADGPKSQGTLCDQMDCSDPTTIALLKMSLLFEREGTGKYAPWKLSQQGRLFLAQHGGE